MSNKKEQLHRAFSSFPEQKLRILKAAKELEYHLAIAKKQMNPDGEMEDFSRIADDPLKHFHFSVKYMLGKIRTHRLFHMVRDEARSYTIRSIPVNENAVADSCHTLKSATFDLIKIMRTEIDKSLFFHWQGTEPLKVNSTPNWNAKYRELEILPDIVHVKVVEVPFLVS